MFKHITFVVFFGILGYLLGTQIGDVSQYAGLLQYLQYSFLAIGLYGAVYGIDLNELQHQKKTAMIVVTLGVCFKILFIGGVLYLITGMKIAWLLGAILAQIDPLSTAKLSDSSSLSKSGKSLLNTRASFDDPMTVLIALYILVPLLFGSEGFNVLSYIQGLGGNFVFAFIVFFLSKTSSHKIFQILLLCISFIVAIPLQWMLGIALIALFLRPNITGFDEIIGKSVQIAFYSSIVMLGLYLVGTGFLDLGNAVILGILAFIAQIIAVYVLVHSVSPTDKKILAFAQYNGITSIILATSLRHYDHGLVSYTAIAIIMITLLYTLCNAFLLGSNK